MKASELVDRVESLSLIVGDAFMCIRDKDGTHIREVKNISRDLFGNIIIE